MGFFSEDIVFFLFWSDLRVIWRYMNKTELNWIVQFTGVCYMCFTGHWCRHWELQCHGVPSDCPTHSRGPGQLCHWDLHRYRQVGHHVSKYAQVLLQVWSYRYRWLRERSQQQCRSGGKYPFWGFRSECEYVDTIKCIQDAYIRLVLGLHVTAWAEAYWCML